MSARKLVWGKSRHIFSWSNWAIINWIPALLIKSVSLLIKTAAWMELTIAIICCCCCSFFLLVLLVAYIVSMLLSKSKKCPSAHPAYWCSIEAGCLILTPKPKPNVGTWPVFRLFRHIVQLFSIAFTKRLSSFVIKFCYQRRVWAFSTTVFS